MEKKISKYSYTSKVPGKIIGADRNRIDSPDLGKKLSKKMLDYYIQKGWITENKKEVNKQ